MYNILLPTGVSYYPPDRNIEHPWHQSTNGHGTVMANMISRINPYTCLEVMRIEDGIDYMPGGVSRTISAQSAANAIEGAVLRKADIISMSWTIRNTLAKISAHTSSINMGTYSGERKRTPDEIAIEALQTAIGSAKSSGILMFCSAADDIQLLGKDLLPFSAAPECIFRIGAALPKGQRDPMSEDVKKISYFFPGNQVAEARNPRSAEPVKYHDGSSVSTALGAGLASLIMYCTNVMATYHKAKAKAHDSVTHQTFADWRESLKIDRNMRHAFDNINDESNEDAKFLPVWTLFGDATEKINKAQGEQKIRELDTLVRQLCHKI